ncbi:SH2 domain-containing protein 7 [Hyla sarda]|uniref:SH2 domain-containing protein 7 n=1 Tax=Hyla sarda TaxID=327740 RepID=UPI0024C22522|nr:SH2 domain-containing protein 7 [Hyla sarda]
MSKNDNKGTLGRGPVKLPVMQSSDDGLPDWFHGIMSRRDCEELLKNKDIGYFIIRLSQRTFGYILSYKGKDRCRHFIINQLSSGELVVSGDSHSHASLPALISYYQNTPIEPYGEKLSLSYIQFSENDKYDKIQRPNSKIEKSVSQNKTGIPKIKGGNNPIGQNKQTMTNAQDTAPPLPERSGCINEDDDNELIYAKPRKEANGNSNKDVHYSLVKDTQINQKNVIKMNPQNVVYSEVKTDHSVPSALGHLHGSSQSFGPEAVKLAMDPRNPSLISSLNELSECEVMEMRFATSIQTVNSKTMSGPFLHSRAECPSSSFLFQTAVSDPEAEDTYAEVPFGKPSYTNEYHTVDKISNYSMCTTNTFDHISTHTSKEVTSRGFHKKVAHASAAQDNLYETVSRDFTTLAVRKQNVAKVEKPKRLFFGDKKK